MTDEARIAEVWRVEHAYLVNLAFGILGDVGLAEDAVQEAFARLVAGGDLRVEDERGWLIVVTTRICLDKVRSAPRRREWPEEAGVLDRTDRGRPHGDAPDPQDRITLDDEVRMALLVVLQRLSPAERVAFVLHDIFRLPFDAIAEMVGRPAASCRQLARRARQKLSSEDEHDRFQVARSEHLAIAERFLEACSTGDMTGLMAVLDPDVSGDVDLGSGDSRTGTVRHGARAVAHNLLQYFGTATLVLVPGRSSPLVMAFVEGKLNAVLALDIDHSQVAEIHVLADPVKMALLSEQLSTAS